MASPRRTPAAGSGDKENICQERDGVLDCPTLRQVGAVSTKRKKKPGGFNLRKSIAWNPAFFTEEVLQFRNEGEIFLYDLGSTHGSFINKTQVQYVGDHSHISMELDEVVAAIISCYDAKVTLSIKEVVRLQDDHDLVINGGLTVLPV